MIYANTPLKSLVDDATRSIHVATTVPPPPPPSPCSIPKFAPRFMRVLATDDVKVNPSKAINGMISLDFFMILSSPQIAGDAFGEFWVKFTRDVKECVDNPPEMMQKGAWGLTPKMLAKVKYAGFACFADTLVGCTEFDWDEVCGLNGDVHFKDISSYNYDEDHVSQRSTVGSSTGWGVADI